MSGEGENAPKAKPDWYREPRRPTRSRYWDGEEWTEQRGPAALLEATLATGGRAPRGFLLIGGGLVTGAAIVVGVILTASGRTHEGESRARATTNRRTERSGRQSRRDDQQPQSLSSLLVDIPSEPPAIPTIPLETIIMVEGGQTLAFVEGIIWPPVGSVVELGNPNRDAVVRDVRLRLFPSKASVVVRVDELPEGETIPVPDPPVDHGESPT